MKEIINMETFKEAISEMMRKRNGKKKHRARKYYIKSLETEEHIIIQNYHRFQMKIDNTRVWSDIVCYNKSTNTVTLYDGGEKFKNFENISLSNMTPNAINSYGVMVRSHYDLNKSSMIFLSF